MSDIVLQGRGICTNFGSKREREQVLFDVDVDVYEGSAWRLSALPVRANRR